MPGGLQAKADRSETAFRQMKVLNGTTGCAALKEPMSVSPLCRFVIAQSLCEDALHGQQQQGAKARLGFAGRFL